MSWPIVGSSSGLGLQNAQRASCGTQKMLSRGVFVAVLRGRRSALSSVGEAWRAAPRTRRKCISGRSGRGRHACTRPHPCCRAACRPPPTASPRSRLGGASTAFDRHFASARPRGIAPLPRRNRACFATPQRPTASMLKRLCPDEAPHTEKYLAWGWWTTMAEVDCSGSSMSSSERAMPISSAWSSANNCFWSARLGQAG